jgi:hypothetical protein
MDGDEGEGDVPDQKKKKKKKKNRLESKDGICVWESMDQQQTWCMQHKSEMPRFRSASTTRDSMW